MRVILMGTGGMSCLFAARLSKAAHVTLVGTWTEAITAIRERGILLEDSQESRTARVHADYLGAPLTPADLVIVLVKAWQTKRVASHLQAYLNSDGLAISLQNGLGNLELLGARAFPGSTAEGATLLGPGHVRAGGPGPTHAVAPAWVVELFQNSGFESYRCSSSEAESLLWGKLSVSCGINALTALLRVPNGELLQSPNAADLMIRAAAECAAVACARGITLPFPDPAVRVREVAARTATNKSSMLQDILRGAPTECDAINGAVVCEGRRLGIPTPVNEVLWQLVQAAVYQNRSDFPSCG
jgi:2-dehydropantoate 2-reductase